MEDPSISGTPGGASAIPLTSEQPPSDPAPDNQAAQNAAPVASQVKEKLVGALDGRKSALADAVDTLAETVQRSGEQFQGRQDWIASAIGRGAAELGDFANSIRNRDLRDLVSEVHGFATRRPALFMGAALAAGFALARLGKVVASDLSRADLPTMPEVIHAQP